ncbi:hypothetical protein [Paracoccus pantotrophus]|uniref:hypothetical protein n=1 Tax=Paracoccus pantotrophus TaxID=82367 RepID=UPI0011CE5E2B|nr:hypothetical protein [Paracoccus pantotrophus]
MSIKNKFVILSDAHSGTSLLTATLNSHPEIICHGEIFHPDPKDYHIKVPKEEIDPQRLLALREQDAQKFVELVYDRQGVNAVGFKMWRSQNARCCDELLEDQGISKIIYERKNVLAKFSSMLLAKETGVWNINPGAARPKSLDKRLVFNASQFINYFKKHEDLFQLYRNSSKGRTLEISYLDIVDSGFSSVLEFIDVSNMNLAPKKEKLHGSSIMDRFREDDHDAIVETLNKLNRPEWVLE